VALIGATATIATSATLPSSRLEPVGHASARLDASTPRATGRFVLTISAPTIDQIVAGTAPGAKVLFRRGSVQVGGGSAEQIALHIDEHLRISASVVGVSDPPRSGEQPTWTIAELCRPAEACRREFDVSIEWLQPQAGWVSVDVNADLLVVFKEIPTLPSGASAAWEAGEFAADSSPNVQ
jgi:hypothetical protein